jgi:peroxiredoxin
LVARDEPYEIVLSEPLKVSGKVIDAKTGKPIPRFEILVGSIFREGERAYWGREGKKFENQEGHFEITESYPREAYKLRALAEGYAFTEYPEIFKVGQDVRDIVIGLKKGFPIKGKVYSVKKEPLGNVKVILGGQDAHIQVDGIRVAHSRGFSKEAHTDGKGNFAFDGLGEETYQLLLLHSEQGGKILPGIIPSKETKEVQLEPYAKLEGLAYENDKPLADCEISLHPCSPFPRFGRQAFHFYSRTKTDQNSHWGFEKILPGVYAASIMTRIPHGTGYCTHSKSRRRVVLASGERKFIVLGGIGGPTLKGKVTDTTGEPVVGAAVRLSPSFTCGFSSFYDANTQADGTYEITEIQPGKYRAYFSLYEREGARCCGPGKLAMEARRKILIKPDYPEVKLDITLEVGDSAPDFSAETLKGEKICLNDLKGKTVLLDFWSTWCGPCVAEISNVKKAYQKYKDDIVFLGINVDTSKETVAKFIKEEKIEWPQVFDGEGWESGIVKKYGIRGIPAVFLIDQDGKIAAKDLRGESLMQTIESVIKK